MGASHLGSRGSWGRSPSDAGPLPLLLHQGMGSPHAEERGRRKPWSGSSSDPCRAGSTLSTPTMNTSHPALQGQWEGTGHRHAFPSSSPLSGPGHFSSPPSELRHTYLGKAGLCSSASPRSRCWAGHTGTGRRAAAQPCPCPPRAPLLSCLFPSPCCHAPLSLQGLRCPPAILQSL